MKHATYLSFVVCIVKVYFCVKLYVMCACICGGDWMVRMQRYSKRCTSYLQIIMRSSDTVWVFVG